MEAALPREHYVDPDSFARERKMLRHEWTCIGRLDDLGLTEPDRVAVVDFYGESILVTNDGALHAHANVCRHRGAQLMPADAPPCGAKALRCPYHSWTYALDGSLMHAPHADDIDPADFRLTSLAADTWGGWLWIAESPRTTLLEQLGPIPDRVKRYPLADLQLGLRFVYDVAA
ncbi:MAG: aromatic ring-hydroxylating oxygenase subunit alpha, partial [Candidatus Nanopelagicales bacterium]